MYYLDNLETGYWSYYADLFGALFVYGAAKHLHIASCILLTAEVHAPILPVLDKTKIKLWELLNTFGIDE